MTLTEPAANISIDYGHLLITDTNNLTSNDHPEVTETLIRSHAERNFKHLARGLFTMLKDQQGEDDSTLCLAYRLGGLRPPYCRDREAGSALQPHY